MEISAGTVVAKVLLFKEVLWDTFDSAASKAEAYAKWDALAAEAWWCASWHLAQCVDLLCRDKFEPMVPYLDHPEVPRCGQPETLINVWRQLEAVRRSFKTPQGQLDHLKLSQLTHYLEETLHR